MTEFAIRFLANEEKLPAPATRYGEITIGSFREAFLSDLTFWDEPMYERHWRASLAHVLSREKAALITSIADPSTANFIRWWAMYREADQIAFQEQLLFLDELAVPFNPHETEKYMRPRVRYSDDGNEISEWYASVETLKETLARDRT